MKKLILLFLIPALALAGTENIAVNTADGKVKKTSSGVGDVSKPYDFSNVFTLGIRGGGGGGTIPATSSILIGSGTGNALSIGTPAARGLRTVYIAARTDGKAGTGTAEDPINATNDLITIWPSVLALSPKWIQFVNSGVTFSSSNHLDTPNGITIDLGGSTIQAASTFWGQNSGVLSGEQGFLGETDLVVGGDKRHDVTIQNGTIDCNNINQAAANARVNAIWLKGDNNNAIGDHNSNNRILNIHVINFGNRDTGGNEQFVISIGDDGEVANCRFTQDPSPNSTSGTVSVIQLGDPLTGGTGDFIVNRVKIHDNRFDYLYAPAGSVVLGINIGYGSYTDVYSNTFNGLDKGAAIYHDSGDGFKNRIHDNIILGMTRVGGSGSFGVGIYMTPTLGASHNITGLEITNNLITCNTDGTGIFNSSVGGIFTDSIIRGNTVQNNGGGNYGILYADAVRGVIEGNYVTGSTWTGQSYQFTRCDGTTVQSNHGASIYYDVTATNIVTTIPNVDLSGGVLTNNKSYVPLLVAQPTPNPATDYVSIYHASTDRDEKVLLSLLPSAGDVVHDAVQTLTNKRITPRVVFTNHAGTAITPNVDNEDIRAQNNDNGSDMGITINTPGGTPTERQALILAINSSVIQTLSWDPSTSIYVGVAGSTLPVHTTGGGKTDYFTIRWNAGLSKYEVLVSGASATSIPVANVIGDTTTALGVGSIELGHATDTSIIRKGAGQVQIEGQDVDAWIKKTVSGSDFTNSTTTLATITGSGSGLISDSLSVATTYEVQGLLICSATLSLGLEFAFVCSGSGTSPAMQVTYAGMGANLDGAGVTAHNGTIGVAETQVFCSAASGVNTGVIRFWGTVTTRGTGPTAISVQAKAAAALDTATVKVGSYFRYRPL